MSELEHVPDDILDEMMDFMAFLKSQRAREGMETAIASESSLRKIWMNEEENLAWRHL